MKHAPYSTRRHHLLSQLGNRIAIIKIDSTDHGPLLWQPLRPL